MGRRRHKRQRQPAEVERVGRRRPPPTAEEAKARKPKPKPKPKAAVRAENQVSRREAFAILREAMAELTRAHHKRKAPGMNDDNYRRTSNPIGFDRDEKNNNGHIRTIPPGLAVAMYGEFGDHDDAKRGAENPPVGLPTATADATAIAIAASVEDASADKTANGEVTVVDWSTEAGNNEPAQPEFKLAPPVEDPCSTPDMAIAVRVFKGDQSRELPQEVEVIYDDLVYQEIMTYVRDADYEVQGFGRVVIECQPNSDPKKPDKLIFRVVSTILPKQIGSGAETDVDGMDLAIEESATSHMPGELRCWWHSHVMMEARWSGTDVQNMMDQCQDGHLVCTVFNQRGEQRTAIIFRGQLGGVSVPIILDQIPMAVERFIPGRLVEQWKNKFKAKVTKKYGGTHHSYTSNKRPEDGEYPMGGSNHAGYRQFIGPGVIETGPGSAIATRGTVAQDSSKSNLRRGHDFPVRGERYTADELIDWALDNAVKLGFSKDEAVDWASLCEDMISSKRYTLSALRIVLEERMAVEAKKLKPAAITTTIATNEQPLETD